MPDAVAGGEGESVAQDAEAVRAMLMEPDVKVEVGVALSVRGVRQFAQVRIGRRKSVLICSELDVAAEGRADVLRQLADLLDPSARTRS